MEIWYFHYKVVNWQQIKRRQSINKRRTKLVRIGPSPLVKTGRRPRTKMKNIILPSSLFGGKQPSALRKKDIWRNWLPPKSFLSQLCPTMECEQLADFLAKPFIKGLDLQGLYFSKLVSHLVTLKIQDQDLKILKKHYSGWLFKWIIHRSLLFWLDQNLKWQYVQLCVFFSPNNLL